MADSKNSPAPIFSSGNPNQMDQPSVANNNTPLPPTWVQDDPTIGHIPAKAQPLSVDGYGVPQWNATESNNPLPSGVSISQQEQDMAPVSPIAADTPITSEYPQAETPMTPLQEPISFPTDGQQDAPENIMSAVNPINEQPTFVPPQPPPPPPPSFSPPPPPSQDEPYSGPVTADLRPKGGFPKILIFMLLGIMALGGIGFLVTQLVIPNLSGNNSSKQSADGSNSPANNSTGSSKTQASTQKKNVTLTYWGLWEPSTVLQGVLEDYYNQTGVKINYVQQSVKDYQDRLHSAIDSNQGPDIFRYHNTWLPMLKSYLQPDTAKNININDYYPVVANNVSIGGETFGVPLEFDSLALYYNPAIFQKSGVTTPPQTWDELRKTAQKVTLPDYSVSTNRGKPMERGGVALGTTNNVDNFSDILGLMLLQNGADPGNPNDKLTEDTLTFYTKFSTEYNVWNDTLPASTYAFATEKVAMIIAPSWRAFEIAAINPSLKFATAPVPQLPGDKIGWATYWVEGVSRKSTNTSEAWKFLAYMSSDAVVTKLYTAASQVRLFGEPYAKKSLASTLVSQNIVGSFVAQGETAKSWYLASRTFDNGINDQIIKYYEDAVNSVLKGTQPSQTLPTLSQGVVQVLKKYNVSVITSSNPTQMNPVEPLNTTPVPTITPSNTSVKATPKPSATPAQGAI